MLKPSYFLISILLIIIFHNCVYMSVLILILLSFYLFFNLVESFRIFPFDVGYGIIIQSIWPKIKISFIARNVYQWLMLAGEKKSMRCITPQHWGVQIRVMHVPYRCRWNSGPLSTLHQPNANLRPMALRYNPLIWFFGLLQKNFLLYNFPFHVYKNLCRCQAV